MKPFLLLLIIMGLTSNLFAVNKSTAPDSSGILTPKPGPVPHINGPKVYGVHPGSPFLYRIPCTGIRPMQFGALDLPEGLTLDSQSGIITGVIAKAGTYRTTLSAQNAMGRSTREFRIKVGETIALTPPMGWNDWYIHYNRIDDEKMRKAADQMIESGMADFGYQYVNIDDCWMKHKGDEPYHDAEGAVLPNTNFPDMKGLADYIHSKGLKAGLYTSPGPWTCGNYVGAFKHEATDVRKFAEWGFDFLKYDWCSFGLPDETRNWPSEEQKNQFDLDYLKFPYRMISELIKDQPRDIVLNLCQYGMGDVWEWGGDFGNCWRTTDDLGAVPRKELPGFYKIGMSNARHWEYARPGAWNDPDYILIGWIGSWGDDSVGKSSKLTPDEQYSYMSMWTLMAAPLIFSGDMGKLDDFTLNILCNSEVIDVDQDPLGKQGRILRQTDDEFVLIKELEDGSRAVGLFNLLEEDQVLTIDVKDIGFNGMVRDLWRQIDIGNTAEMGQTFSVRVKAHGVALLKITPAAKTKG
jgi:alpha-galactosidase